jgi:hypothetical protein
MPIRVNSLEVVHRLHTGKVARTLDLRCMKISDVHYIQLAQFLRLGNGTPHLEWDYLFRMSAGRKAKAI